MRENAEDILNGDYDMITGEYIGPGQGFPRTLGDRNKNAIAHDRMEYCLQKLVETPGVSKIEHNNKRIDFLFNGNKIQMFPYTGWHTGKGIVDGRGINNLLKQLNPNNLKK